MSDLDLDAIRGRYALTLDKADSQKEFIERLWASKADVRPLLAEVERLKAEVAEAHRTIRSINDQRDRTDDE